MEDNRVWINVGFDLTCDVGGWSACRACMILMYLDKKYRQNVKIMFASPLTSMSSSSSFVDIDRHVGRGGVQ